MHELVEGLSGTKAAADEFIVFGCGNNQAQRTLTWPNFLSALRSQCNVFKRSVKLLQRKAY